MRRSLVDALLVGWLAPCAVALVVWIQPAIGRAATGVGVDHSLLDRVLATYVDDQGRVDYAGLKAHPDDLDGYVGLLARVSPKNHPDQFPTREDRLAYWINAYNAFVLKGVIDAYPVKSVKEIKLLSGFFNRTRFTVGEKRYTLNDIEHGILRKVYGDPRIHAAINCASAGCPRLPRKAFRPEGLGGQLEDAMRFFVRESRNVRIDRPEGAVYLSEIFKWFEGDFTGWYSRKFGRDGAGITGYLTLFLTEPDAAYLRQHPDVTVRYIDYGWSLNDQALAHKASF